MKRKIIYVAVCFVLPALTMACVSGPSVARVDAETRTDVSGRWNDTDVRIVCDSLLNSCFSSPRMNQQLQDYADRNKGQVPTVIIGQFINASTEPIDTSIISGMMRTALINSGKLEFVEGGAVRDQLRAEKTDQLGYASEDTAPALGAEIAANFMLTGEVRSIVDRSGGTTIRSYFVKATMTNIETNRIVWEGENNEIKKVVQQPKSKL